MSSKPIRRALEDFNGEDEKITKRLSKLTLNNFTLTTGASTNVIKPIPGAPADLPPVIPTDQQTANPEPQEFPHLAQESPLLGAITAEEITTPLPYNWTPHSEGSRNIKPQQIFRNRII